MDHLNSEEKTSLGEICFDYQDVFFLPGDRLSCTSAVKHTNNLERGTVPINTRPYRPQRVIGNKLIGRLQTYWKKGL
jgi:hypothetical protein